MKAKWWGHIGLASILSFITASGGATMDKNSNSKTHFKWYSVATAPRDYPMEIIDGTFFYKGQDVGDQIPRGETLTQGWGGVGKRICKRPRDSSIAG